MEKLEVSFKNNIEFNTEQCYAPLVERLNEYKKNPSVGFHIPGHTRGSAILPQFKNVIGMDALLCDTTDEFDNLGTLHPATGAIKEAMDVASICYNSKRTFFITSGSTISNLALAFGVISPEDEIIVARNSHRSVLTGTILTGSKPYWLMPKKLEDWAIYGAIQPSDLAEKLKNNKNVKFVWVTNPTYEGVVSNIKEIAEICHFYKVPLIVDEAHGSLWNFHEELPTTALQLGADAVVHSLHKTGGALTQASMLHLGKNSLLDENKIEHALKLLHTTSPSILLLASLDAARASLSSNEGKKLIQNDKVEAIIVLPRELFITTDISVTLWILNQNKKGGKYHGRNLRNRKHEILFMDLRQWRENPVKGESKKKVCLVTEQIERAADIYHTWQSVGTEGTNYEVPELYRSVGIAEIESKGWTLTPSKYIEFIDHDLDIDYEKEMARIQVEMKAVMEQEKKSQQMLEDAFRGIGYEID